MSTLTLAQARTLIDGALAAARQHGFKPMGVVVVDAAAQVVASAREDGASALRLDIAHGKAGAAVGMGVNSRGLAARAKDLPAFFGAIASTAGQAFIPQTGAVLITDATGTVTDTDQVARFEYAVGGGPWQQVFLFGNPWWNFQLPGQTGTWRVAVRATDRSGNVATHAAEKIVQLGGKVLTLSDSGGFIHDPDGIDQEKIDWVKTHKTHRRGRIEEYVEAFPKATFHAGKTPWGVPCDVALPCATQNELLGEDAKTLIANGCRAVSEGANMPTDLDGVHAFKHAKILYAPGKASNAGGVAVSGLEMSQNSERRSWKEEELQQMLKDIMSGIHNSCIKYGDQGGGYIDYVKGANIAGFKKVADAMLAFGVV